MRQRLQQGLLTEADTLQAFAQAENINPQLVRVQQAYALAEQQLRLLLGLPETEAIELTDLLNFSVDVRSQSPVFENRPDLVQLKLQNEVLFFQEKADQARRMPNLQLVAQYTWLSQDENFDFNRYRWINTYFVGLQLNIPIFGGFANTSRVQQTRIRQQQNQESYQFALKQAQTEWQRLRGNLTEISAQITSQEKVVQAANRAYQAIFDRWKQGLTKQTDLRQAELVLQESKLNYLGFIYQYLVLDNELKRVQGEL
jgi:outer membrane protein TolC